MDFFLNRYRSLTALLLAILAQLALLSYQIKSNHEVRLIRVWAVTAITPVARLLEGGRGSTVHFFEDYFWLLGVRQQNRQLQSDLDRIKMENQYLRAQLDTADRGRELAIFQAGSPSKTVAARIIGNTNGVGNNVVIIDRGAASGLQNGMAVITPNGIAGKVIDVYPTASYVRLITDPSFAAGVVSQQHHVHGTLRGQGSSTPSVEYIQNEDPVDPGEWFYTSGDDLIFPKGLPVGTVSAVRNGKARKEVALTPSGLVNGLEVVLIVVDGVHQDIPPVAPSGQSVHLQPPASGEPDGPIDTSSNASGPLTTDADRMIDQYRRLGEAQKHVFGERGAGAPNFNAPVPDVISPKDQPSDGKSGHGP
ncbi:MAG TPA: rod shape-determining protein MreC [Bryobacteraceae bacterium]|nr:rod shape-determining protein MreC [Bryobacteraceae bacterium]